METEWEMKDGNTPESITEMRKRMERVGWGRWLRGGGCKEWWAGCVGEKRKTSSERGSSQPNKWGIEMDPRRETERVREQEKRDTEIDESTENTAVSRETVSPLGRANAAEGEREDEKTREEERNKRW